MEGYDRSTYGDGFADVYDDWYADLGDPEEVADRLFELAPSGRLLELGVGTGRLAVCAAARGLAVVGVDTSTAMLERLRRAPAGSVVRAVRADMAELPCRSSTFDVVLAAYNTLFNLPDPKTKRRCLESVRRCTRPGGAVVIEAFVPPVATGDRDGVTVREVGVDHVVLTASMLDATTQEIAGQHIEIRSSGIRLRPWFLHYLHPDELDELAASTGLRLESRWAGWSREPFDDDSDSHVSVYRAS
jgi:SAM-dependent methyltransferase